MYYYYFSGVNNYARQCNNDQKKVTKKYTDEGLKFKEVSQRIKIIANDIQKAVSWIMCMHRLVSNILIERKHQGYKVGNRVCEEKNF